MVLGAVLVVTGPPHAQRDPPGPGGGQDPALGGIVIDPIGALFALLVFEAVSAAGDLVGHTPAGPGQDGEWGRSSGSVPAGSPPCSSTGTGCRSACTSSVLALVLVTLHPLSDWLSHESGLLAVTVFGIWLANLGLGWIWRRCWPSGEDLAVILISSLFILLAARLDLAQLCSIGPMVLALLCVVQFVAARSASWSRPGVRTCPGTPAPARLDSPRGMSGGGGQRLLRHQHARAGIEGCRQAGALVFAVIIFTVVLQSPDSHAIGQIARHAPERPQCLAAHRRQLGGPGHRQGRWRTRGSRCSSPILPGALRSWPTGGLPCYFGSPGRARRTAPAPHQHQHRAGALPSRHSNAPRGAALRPPLRGGEGPLLRSSEQHGKANREAPPSVPARTCSVPTSASPGWAAC